MTNWHSPELSAAYEVIAKAAANATGEDRADLIEAMAAIELADGILPSQVAA